MNFFTRFLDNLGGPESVCKSLYTTYSLFKDRGYSHEDAMRQNLENRYSVLKIIKKEEFPAILEDNKELALLALYCIIRENPYRGKEKFSETALRVLKYFSDTDPSQCTGLATIIMVMQEAVREGTKSMVQDFSNGDIAKYAEEDDYPCPNDEGEQIKRQFVSLPKELEGEWDALQAMNSDAAILALEDSARGRELRQLLHDYGALLALHRADFFLLKERVDSLFPIEANARPQPEEQKHVEVITCPECGVKLRIPQNGEARVRIHCPGCDTWFDRINKSEARPKPSPSPSQERPCVDYPPIIVSCPRCQQRMKIPANKAVTVSCPSCGEVFDHP